MHLRKIIAVWAVSLIASGIVPLSAASQETSFGAAVSTAAPRPDTRTNREKLSDPNPVVRQNALIYIGLEKKKSNVPLIAKMLQDPEVNVRRAAVSALVTTGDKSGIKPLTDTFASEKNLAVRMNIVVALGDLKAASALPLLTEILKDPYPPFRGEALRALGKINNPETYAQIVARVADEAEGVQVMASEVVGNLKLASAVPSLLNNLENRVPVVRRASVNALGQVADAASVPRLEQMLKDTDSLVASAAKEAIDLITKREQEAQARAAAAESKKATKSGGSHEK